MRLDSQHPQDTHDQPRPVHTGFWAAVREVDCVFPGLCDGAADVTREVRCLRNMGRCTEVLRTRYPAEGRLRMAIANWFPMCLKYL